VEIGERWVEEGAWEEMREKESGSRGWKTRGRDGWVGGRWVDDG
jgi:hypothetical protein